MKKQVKQQWLWVSKYFLINLQHLRCRRSSMPGAFRRSSLSFARLWVTTWICCVQNVLGIRCVDVFALITCTVLFDGGLWTLLRCVVVALVVVRILAVKNRGHAGRQNGRMLDG